MDRVPRPGQLGILLLTALIGAGATPRAHAQTVDTTLWVANGNVDAIARTGSTLYIGGSFSHVGPATGSGVPIDRTTGLAVSSFPKVTGSIYAVTADGTGGWYIGGSFTHVGGIARAGLAHILADGTLGGWNPGADAAALALAVSGGLVYVGGNFTTVGGQPRSRIAALDIGTGAPTAWNPSADGSPLAIVPVGDTIYVGGTFTTIGGQTRNGIAALDATTGVATSWNPNATGDFGFPGTVYALAVNGGAVYAGGDFISIGGQARDLIAALDPVTGNATAWNPGATGNVVFAIAVSWPTVYVGGDFTAMGGQPRGFVAALSAATGAATPWNPNPISSSVSALAVRQGTIYVTVGNTTIGGQQRRGIAAIDSASGLATAWNPTVNGNIFALAINGSQIYAGGAFSSVGGQDRSRLAALDVTTGTLTAWNPSANSSVSSIALGHGVVYVGGSFTNIGGQMRNRIAALDPLTGLATAWNPDADNSVLALAVTTDRVYAGGAFANIGGLSRARLARLSPSNGAADAVWNPNGAASFVRALAASGDRLFAGGDFLTIAGQSRNRLAALDTVLGNATTWNPDANQRIWTLEVADGRVYAGGEFTTIGGQARSRAAALDPASGLAAAWNPGPDGTVRALGVGAGIVYLGGSFLNVGGLPRNRVAAADTAVGAVVPWNPGMDGTVTKLLVSGSAVYAGGNFTTVGIRSQSHMASLAALLALGSVSPQGGAGTVTLTAFGSAFQDGASVTLERTGESDLVGSNVIVAAGGASLSATFDLAGATLGAWDVVVTTPDLQSATLAGGFTVEDPAPVKLRVNILGPELVRANRRRPYDLVLENLGNSDVTEVPLWISGLPAGVTLETDFPVAPPPQAGGEPDWTAVPLTLDGPGGAYTVLVIPRMPPGITVRRVYVTAMSAVTTFELGASLAPPWADGLGLRACVSGGGVIGAPSCMGAQLTAISAHLAATPGIQALSGVALWAKVAWQCEGAATLPDALAAAEQVLDFMLQPIEGAGVPTDCEVALVPRWQDRRRVTVVSSLDPNDKFGIGGVGPSRSVGASQVLSYTIRFENEEDASAPAQEVLVTDVLDLSKFDVNSVALGPITFGRAADGRSHTLYPGYSSTSFMEEVDLPERDLIVRVETALDVATGVLTWSFTSVDPATGLLPDDPLSGFLPQNVTPGEGEGSVLFYVKLKPGLAGGTVVSNQASLNFDGDVTLTGAWSNELDATAPESAVLPLPATQDSLSFTVRWEAPGPPPDLHDYSVYVSENGGPPTPWRVHVTATADTITRPGGRTYAFYSLARDSSGNLEAVPGAPDVETYSRVAVEPRAGALRLALEGATPNPVTGGDARMWFTLPSREGALLEVYDVAGRRVWRREVGSLGPGRHGVDVGVATRAAGLYFVRLTQSGQTLHARLVAIE